MKEDPWIIPKDAQKDITVEMGRVASGDAPGRSISVTETGRPLVAIPCR
jgi:hypothetical protein